MPGWCQGVRKKDLEWSSTHCPRINCWVSVLVAVVFPIFWYFVHVASIKCPYISCQTPIAFPAFFECHRWDHLISLVSPSQLSPISPILGKLAFFDYFDGFDCHTYLAICFFFCVCSTYLRLGMHHSFAMLIIHPIPSIHVVMYSSTDSRMAVFFWWQIRGTAELPPPPPLRLLHQ